jgi:DNA-binding beta-propeller fold protein YncE
MRRVCALYVLGLCLAAAKVGAQQPGASTELPGSPFFIKQTWIVGGAGPWDYLTMDSRAERLYIAHGHTVQVVDVTAGSVVGEISGLGEAHSIALDDSGEFGYISDGAGGKVIVFDRRSLQTVATIEGIPNPRALVFEPQTRLLFAVRTDPVPTPSTPTPPRTTTHIALRPAPLPPPPPNPKASSSIIVIDTQTNAAVGQILLSGTLGFAQTDGRGQVFVNIADQHRILRFDAMAIASELRKQPESNSPAPETLLAGDQKDSAAPIVLDWMEGRGFSNRRSFARVPGCTTPKSLAIDAAHVRLFVACDNMKLFVLDADSGDRIATLPIGPGVDAIGYDPGRSLIYAANGGASGSLTIIRQHVTDTYSVIQTLPTRQRARTLAVNPDTGQVYLVTDLLGVNLAQSGGIGTLRTDPVKGSFQVLVVGN